MRRRRAVTRWRMKITASRMLYRSLATSPTAYRLVATIANNTATSYVDAMTDAAWWGQPVMNGAGPSENYNRGGNGEKPNVAPDSIRWGRRKRSEVFNEVELPALFDSSMPWTSCSSPAAVS